MIRTWPSSLKGRMSLALKKAWPEIFWPGTALKGCDTIV
jgi:hypothetical protein